MVHLLVVLICTIINNKQLWKHRRATKSKLSWVFLFGHERNLSNHLVRRCSRRFDSLFAQTREAFSTLLHWCFHLSCGTRPHQLWGQQTQAVLMKRKDAFKAARQVCK